MPNGVSCAYFAVRNYEYGKHNNDIFRDGVAGAQAVRTAGAIAESANVPPPLSGALGKIAGFAKKLVYPLIILSGIRTAIKSDDKVKTGCEQAGGISIMYIFEKSAEKGLSALEKRIKNSKNIPNNKFIKTAAYFLKGVSYIAASMSGFNIGKNTAGSTVDLVRNIKNNKSKAVIDNVISPETTDVYSEFSEFFPKDETVIAK